MYELIFLLLLKNPCISTARYLSANNILGARSSSSISWADCSEGVFHRNPTPDWDFFLRAPEPRDRTPRQSCKQNCKSEFERSFKGRKTSGMKFVTTPLLLLLLLLILCYVNELFNHKKKNFFIYILLKYLVWRINFDSVFSLLFWFVK